MTDTIKQVTLTRPDDFHLHLRDGLALQSVVSHSAAQFRRAIIMPNLRPPIITTELAAAYRERIMAALPEGSDFEPLMTLYLTDDTTPAEIRKAKQSKIIAGIKLYPAGATTHSDAGVTDLSKCMKTLETMQEEGVPLLMHGEVTDPEIDIFDREAVFIDKILIPLRKSFPELKIVFEHITTQTAADFVRDSDAFTGATITPQHLLFNRNALFAGGIRPHFYCLPVLKREENRLALIKAATSGLSRFFAGTDSAPHAKNLKENACGCAGCFTGLHALELYAEVFESMDALAQLEAFTSFNGADFYGLERNREKVTLTATPWSVPETLPFADEAVVPLRAGETVRWKLL